MRGTTAEDLGNIIRRIYGKRKIFRGRRAFYLVLAMLGMIHYINTVSFRQGNMPTLYSIRKRSRPVMHTFYDESSLGDSVEDRRKLLNQWKRSWNEAGWDVRVLTMEEAKMHEAFPIFQNSQEEINMETHTTQSISIPVMSPENRNEVYRLLAMATKIGGWVCDFDVFPLHIISDDGHKLPNNGKLTLYDYTSPSMISGSFHQFDTLVRKVIDGLSKIQPQQEASPVQQVLQRISKSNPPQFVHYGSQLDDDTEVYRGILYTNNQGQMRISNSNSKTRVLCPKHQPKFLRMTPKVLEINKTNGAWPHISFNDLHKFKADISGEYITKWKRYCPKPDRPKVHTFFESMDGTGETAGMDNAGNSNLINTWKQAWYEAGFEPVVLTMDDAKKHPDFNSSQQRLEQLPMRFYNKLCTYRWYAMAVEGGGYMVDYDTFPLAITPFDGRFMQNGGKLTLYDFVVPSIVSGSFNEYTRFANLITDIVGRPDYNGEVMSDMLALDYLRKHQPDSFVRHSNRYHNRLVYNGPYYNEKEEVDCIGSNGMIVVHFAHKYVVEKATTLTNVLRFEDIEQDLDMVNKRGAIAKQFLKDWSSKCKSRSWSSHGLLHV
mmetsp:Transcript_8341/g.11905  ORF Transcript_8341/g.11905 Transcript_8341/m.11905 type:complete len:603 (+) Transcript_8341:111-1919(+)